MRRRPKGGKKTKLAAAPARPNGSIFSVVLPGVPGTAS
jgi:hypothetical protein